MALAPTIILMKIISNWYIFIKSYNYKMPGSILYFNKFLKIKNIFTIINKINNEKKMQNTKLYKGIFL